MPRLAERWATDVSTHTIRSNDIMAAAVSRKSLNHRAETFGFAACSAAISSVSPDEICCTLIKLQPEASKIAENFFSGIDRCSLFLCMNCPAQHTPIRIGPRGGSWASHLSIRSGSMAGKNGGGISASVLTPR